MGAIETFFLFRSPAVVKNKVAATVTMSFIYCQRSAGGVSLSRGNLDEMEYSNEI